MLVLGDSIVRHTGTGNEALDVRCFPGIRTAQLRRVIESQDLGRPDAVILHVGTNDSKRNVDYVIGDIYELVTAARKKFPTAKLILSGLLRRRDTRWTRIGLINDGMDWVARSLGARWWMPTPGLQTATWAAMAYTSTGGVPQSWGAYLRRSARTPPQQIPGAAEKKKRWT